VLTRRAHLRLVEAPRRRRIEDDTALVMIWTGMPRPDREYRFSVVHSFGHYNYKMADGSIVEVTRHQELSENGSTRMIHVEQYWPKGRPYDGDYLVEQLSDISR
jgi:hypothetical protein